jgi:uncharacterized protein YqjF (DUF2071 family)
MAQSWHDLLFAHWPLPVATLRSVVPSALTIDTFDGRAWLAVVPFHMTGVRPRGIPPLPGLSAFPELNVRTYVTVNGKPGVYFFSLDAGNRLAVEGARRLYCLPYFQARMEVAGDGGGVRYRSRRVDRRGAPAELRGHYGPVGEVFRARPGSLEAFLTERYCLYTIGPRGATLRVEIHHAPWPLQPAEAAFEVDTMTAGLGITRPAASPLLHFARRLDVVVWPVHRVERAA